VPSYTAYLIETFVTLLAVCALAFVVLWGARRLGVGRPSGPIVLQGHLPLDARRAIYLVRVGPHVFIVGAGEGGFTKLGELPASELPALSVARESSFATVLSRVFNRSPERTEAGPGEPSLEKRSPPEPE
jgi:flagellar biogenesis protein FliO